MKRQIAFISFSVFFLLSFLVTTVNAYQISASTDKIVYVANETLTIEGTIDYASPINLTATFYTSADVQIASLINESTNGAFSFYYLLNETSPGSYYVVVSDGIDSIYMNFKVVSELVYLEAHLIASPDVIGINTSTQITTGGQLDGNFTELLDLSISRVLHYGNETINGTLYHFVLVDQNFNQTYDTLYVDDDKTFLLYNDTEDGANETERILGEGDTFKDYIVGEIEFNTGNKVLLGRPVNSSVYSPGEIVNFAVVAKDLNGILLSGQSVNVRLLDSDGTVQNSTTNTTNEFGYFVADFTAPTTTGMYTIDLNNSLGMEFFFVESFKLFGKVTDLADNPMYVFAPDPIVRISATAKDATGNPINLSSVYAVVSYPNGTSVTLTLAGSDGIYSYDLDLDGAPTGEYGVRIVGVYGSDEQEVLTGFAIESVSLEVLPINIEFMEEAEGPEAMVNAFAPGSNVTILTVLSNVSGGGLMAKGPEGMATIDIDNSSTPTDECVERVALVELKDDRGVAWSVNYNVMNLTNFIATVGGAPEDGPPPGLLRQCMIVFQAPNRTGVYRADVKVTHPLGEETAGATFGVQRLYAVGSSVDFKGEDFWFFAPNTTIRIKLKVVDLATREDVSPDKILDAKIIEMHREFPTYEDVFTSDYRAIANEGVENGTINFTAPATEGFFSMKFKFKANVSGIVEEGVGNAFFMLKKYMIWGEPVCEQQFGPCIVGVGKNVTLQVNVVDIDQGSMLDLGMSGTCTGCSGLVVDVNFLFNDQLMKEMEKEVDYTVIPGSVVNSTATLTIVPTPSTLPPGWYHVDLNLTDPTDPTKQYFGWAWFEIRNFYVETMPIIEENGNLTAFWGQPTYGVSSPVLFTVTPRDPATGNILTPDSISVESVRWMQTWPPLEVSFVYNISDKNVSLPWGGVEVLQVVNVTGMQKEGWHQANVKVDVAGKGSDIGTFWFDIASYRVDVVYRGMEEWPPVFGPNENITVNVSAYDFDNNPHNLSENGTKLRSVWDERTGRPVKLNSSTICVENNCTITANLSSLGLGRYHADFVINDTQGAKKETGIFFVIKSLVVNIPTIEEAWIGFTDTGDRELNVDNDRDFCDNERWLQNWNDTYGNGTFCIDAVGEWRDGSCNGEGTDVFVESNTTHLWINSSDPNATGENFTAAGKLWTIVEIDGAGMEPYFHVKLANGSICGRKWINCGPGGCEEVPYMMTPPSNYSNFYHGHVRDLKEDEWIGQEWGVPFNQTKWVYIYHNTSYVWMTNSTDLSSVNGKTVGETITDPYGGIWRVESISKNRVNLFGLNVLGKSGAFINTSLSKSGTIKMEPLREQWLGGWDKSTGQQRGMDLNGDGLTNSTVYIAITDNASAGVYDTFFFSNDSNFSKSPNPIWVNDPDRNNRKFGEADELTLLSIDPRANRVKFYSNRTGDWADLGEFKVGSNVTIPIIVRTPAGDPETANISIKYIMKKIGDAPPQMVPLTPVPNKTISGIDEIRVNLTALGHPESGEYSFEITATKDGTEERLEEWKWPRATMRAFLAESSVGDGGYISGFVPLPLTRYDWESYGEITRIRSDRRNTSNIVDGILTHAHPFDWGGEGCKVYNSTADITSELNPNITALLKEDESDQLTYYFYNSTSTTLYKNTTGCSFNVSVSQTTYQEGDYLIIPKEGRDYNVSILRIDVYEYGGCGGNDCWRATFGVAGVNSTTIEPMRNDTGNPDWGIEWGYMQDVNAGGILYDVILANDTSIDYPMCSVWNIQECTKKAWFDTDGNFSDAVPAGIGENFTSDLYLARIGPGPWEGISIGNFSQMSGLKPGIEARVRDNTTSYFAVLNESSVNVDLDLNKDGEKNKTFYMITFDDREDAQQNLTSLIVDDDLNITEPWWSTGKEPNVYYKDFYINETGIGEQWGGLPTAIWSGNARFGEWIENASWEDQPEWEIVNYNNTDMLLRKWKWLIEPTENITLVVKAYNFDQMPVEGATVSVERLMRFGPFGGTVLNETAGDYSVVNVQNVTDAAGYGILRLESSTWDTGDYMVVISIESGSNIERTDNWFRIESS